MIFAPVIIPTVNRYQHFKNCIESLSRCTWADKTEVYVAVDYPGKKEHWEGYRLIRNYLSQCGDLGFKSLNVIYRETNYFFSGKGNVSSLEKQLFKIYDRIIFSEDDNVFSPNFLVYINKGLEKFEKDKSVFAVIGYTPPLPIKYSDNSFFRQNVDFYAWGYGMWRDRRMEVRSFFNENGFYDTFSFSNLKKMYKNGRYRLNLYMHLLGRRNTKPKFSDNNLSVYSAINDMDFIMPTLSLVRNVGWDNSGIHCETGGRESLANEIMNQRISNEDSFDFVGTGIEYYDDNRKIFANNRERSFVSLSTLSFTSIKSLIKRVLFL